MCPNQKIQKIEKINFDCTDSTNAKVFSVYLTQYNLWNMVV
jgi:hypothetical protein